jgi:hypothetical protein
LPARQRRLVLDCLDRLEEAQKLLKLFADQRGAARALAHQIGVSEAAVSAGRHGRNVPSVRMLERLRLAVRGAVRID